MDKLVDATEQVAELKQAKETFREQKEVAFEAQKDIERSKRASITMISSLESILAQKEKDADSSNLHLYAKMEELEASLAAKDEQLASTQEMLGNIMNEKNMLAEQVVALEASFNESEVIKLALETSLEESKKIISILNEHETHTKLEMEAAREEAQVALEKANAAFANMQVREYC